MAHKQYGSADFYRILKSVRQKLDGIMSASSAAEAGRLRRDLEDYLDNEMLAAAVRAAKSKANRLARERAAQGGSTDGD